MKTRLGMALTILLISAGSFAKDKRCQVSYLAVDTINNNAVDFKSLADQLNQKGYELDLAASETDIKDHYDKRVWFMNKNLISSNQGVLIEINDKRKLSDSFFKQFKSYINQSITLYKNDSDKRSLYYDENESLYNVFIKVKADHKNSHRLEGHQSQYPKENLEQLASYGSVISALPTCDLFYLNQK